MTSGDVASRQITYAAAEPTRGEYLPMEKLTEFLDFDHAAKSHGWLPGFDVRLWPMVIVNDPRWRTPSRRAADVVYRFYDEDKEPLYFGATGGTPPFTRWQGHRTTKWWDLARYVRLTPVWPNDKHRAAIEREAIRDEMPRFNTAHKRSRAHLALRLGNGPEDVVAQLRYGLLPADFTALVAAFRAIPSTEES